MARRTLSALVVRLVAAVMLLTVGVHAGAPVAAPLERSSGSAFSAATHDVSLASSRKSLTSEAIALIDDGSTCAAVALPAIAMDRTAHPWPPATAPPVRHHASPHCPRGPPAAA